MTQTGKKPAVKDAIAKLGHCLELVSVDPHFHDVTVGLYLNGRTLTVWSFSRKPGIEERIEQIRDRMLLLGDIEKVEDTTHQARLVSDLVLERPLKFMFIDAVEKDPSTPLPEGPITASDNKSRLTFFVTPEEVDGRWVYTVTAEGEHDRPMMRIRAVVGGYMRYGECQRVDKDKFSFPDGRRYDRFARLLLPYARNVSAVEDMLAAADLEGQMTTQTLGFAQS